jgi:hypothetical protein
VKTGAVFGMVQGKNSMQLEKLKVSVAFSLYFLGVICAFLVVFIPAMMDKVNVSEKALMPNYVCIWLFFW